MSRLLRLAKSGDISILLDACQNRQALVSRAHNKRTERLLQQVWNSSFEQLQQAIVEHVDLKRKIYCKHSHGGKLLDGCLEANVTLRDELEIYVEMQIGDLKIVILAAHSHDTANLLPQ